MCIVYFFKSRITNYSNPWPPAAATTASSLCRNDSSSSKLQKKTNRPSQRTVSFSRSCRTVCKSDRKSGVNIARDLLHSTCDLRRDPWWSLPDPLPDLSLKMSPATRCCWRSRCRFPVAALGVLCCHEPWNMAPYHARSKLLGHLARCPRLGEKGEH